MLNANKLISDETRKMITTSERPSRDLSRRTVTLGGDIKQFRASLPQPIHPLKHMVHAVERGSAKLVHIGIVHLAFLC